MIYRRFLEWLKERYVIIDCEDCERPTPYRFNLYPYCEECALDHISPADDMSLYAEGGFYD